MRGPKRFLGKGRRNKNDRLRSTQIYPTRFYQTFKIYCHGLSYSHTFLHYKETETEVKRWSKERVRIPRLPDTAEFFSISIDARVRFPTQKEFNVFDRFYSCFTMTFSFLSIHRMDGLSKTSNSFGITVCMGYKRSVSAPSNKYVFDMVRCQTGVYS